MAFTSQSFQLFCFALVLFMGHWASQAMSRPLDQESVLMTERHERWMAKHGRVYKDEIEKEKRFNIFKENVKRIEEFNRNNAAEGKHSYTLGLNAFTDLTIEEFQATYTGYKSHPNSPWSGFGGLNKIKFMYSNLDDVPSSMDWVQMGAVTTVKDQGQCGCCWAFSSVAAIEGLNQIKNGQLVSLSEQQLVDCFGGCDGNDPDSAFQFIQENNGIATYQDYPYMSDQGVTGQCQQSISPAVSITGHSDVPEGDENALMQAVSQQPISVAISADENFKDYNGGIFSEACDSNLNHAVTVVGYGTDSSSGQDYWLIKNSWGETWGESGYMRMLRGENVCCVASHASFPTM